MHRPAIIATALLILWAAPLHARPARSCAWTPGADDAPATLSALRRTDVPTSLIFFQSLWGQTHDCSVFAAGLGWVEARRALAETDSAEKAEWKKEARSVLARAAELDSDEETDARDAEALLFADDLTAADMHEIGVATRDGPPWRRDAARLALARYLAKPFADSTPVNADGPARDAIAALTRAAAQAGGDLAVAAKTALFAAACEADRSENGKVPYALFAGIRPAGSADCMP